MITMDLTPWVDKNHRQFVPGALDPCKSYDGKLPCLRNDIARTCSGNKPLMEEFDMPADPAGISRPER